MKISNSTALLSATFAFLLSLFLTSCGDPGTLEPPATDDHSNDTIMVVTSIDSFKSAMTSVTEIDFETLPVRGSSCNDDTFPRSDSIPNPLTLQGTTFHDNYCLESGYCSSPTCQPDPDNAQQGNIVLALNTGGIIDLPAGTKGVMLIVEGIGDSPFTVKATDSSGLSKEVTSRGILYGVAAVGFTTAKGISRVEVKATGPTADCPVSPCGPLGFSAVYVGK
jgi:hypothetical protein